MWFFVYVYGGRAGTWRGLAVEGSRDGRSAFGVVEGWKDACFDDRRIVVFVCVIMFVHVAWLWKLMKVSG